MEERDKNWINYLRCIQGTCNLKPSPSFEPLPELILLVRQGIPPAFRSKAWVYLSKSDLHRKKFPCNYFLKLCSRVETLSDQVKKTISKDLRRTGDLTMKDIESLERVLSCYALHNPHIGYCQSMNFVVSVLLTYCNEEDSFFILISLIDEEMLPRNTYSPSMIGLHTDQYVLMHLIHDHFSTSIAAMMEEEFQFVLVSTLSWFSCCFINDLQGEVLMRVFDCLMNEGSSFLFNVSLNLIRRASLCTDKSLILESLRSVGKSISNADLFIKECSEYGEKITSSPSSLKLPHISTSGLPHNSLAGIGLAHHGLMVSESDASKSLEDDRNIGREREDSENKARYSQEVLRENDDEEFIIGLSVLLPKPSTLKAHVSSYPYFNKESATKIKDLRCLYRKFLQEYIMECGGEAPNTRAIECISNGSSYSPTCDADGLSLVRRQSRLFLCCIECVE